MRIAIDARELAGQPTGVGRYLAELLASWSREPTAAAHDFILCGPGGLEAPAVRPARTSVVTAPGSGTVWEQLTLRRLLRAAGAHVLFAPAYSAPLWCPIPVVVTVHDVSFAAHPEWFSWREGTRRRVLARLSASAAVRVITESHFSKREIVAHLGVDVSKVDVIALGVTARRGASQPRSTSDPRILFVGSLFNRRHIPELVEGFSRFAARHTSARLDIVGDNRTRPHVDLADLIARSPARDRIEAHTYVPETVLADLYAAASAFVFLSEYEGFGLTPLEALSAGVPAVVLDTAVAREIYGEAALYVPRPDPPLVAEAIERAVEHSADRARVLAAGSAQLGRYDWSECARRTLEIVVSAAR